MVSSIKVGWACFEFALLCWWYKNLVTSIRQHTVHKLLMWKQVHFPYMGGLLEVAVSVFDKEAKAAAIDTFPMRKRPSSMCRRCMCRRNFYLNWRWDSWSPVKGTVIFIFGRSKDSNSLRPSSEVSHLLLANPTAARSWMGSQMPNVLPVQVPWTHPAHPAYHHLRLRTAGNKASGCAEQTIHGTRARQRGCGCTWMMDEDANGGKVMLEDGVEVTPFFCPPSPLLRQAPCGFSGRRRDWTPQAGVFASS